MTTSHARIRCLALALGVALAACSGADDGPGLPTTESWTIGIYMAADDNLDRAATNDINEILGAPRLLWKPASSTARMTQNARRTSASGLGS